MFLAWKGFWDKNGSKWIKYELFQVSFCAWSYSNISLKTNLRFISEKSCLEIIRVFSGWLKKTPIFTQGSNVTFYLFVFNLTLIFSCAVQLWLKLYGWLWNIFKYRGLPKLNEKKWCSRFIYVQNIISKS